MIDSHCHIADEAFADDLEEVAARALNAGVSHGICVLSMDDDGEASRVPRVEAAWPELGFAIGIHPHQAEKFDRDVPGSVAKVRAAASANARIKAIGEIGLDYHYDLAPRELQRGLFRNQVVLAGEMQLPVIVHTREAEEDTRAVFQEVGKSTRGVLHCFTGTLSMARWAVGFGLYVSFAGIVTFANAVELRQVARDVPLDRLLVETDCPYLAPVPFRGQRNEPAHVVHVARMLADLKQVSMEDFNRAVTANFFTLFGQTNTGSR